MYATPGLASRKAPALVLLCGDVPGGDAGTWSRRLCINDSTLSGAMFEYVTRAQALGWSLVIPDLHGAGDVGPYKHLCDVWRSILAPSEMTQLLMVGHSYGAPIGFGLLKAEAGALERLGAVAFTDGMSWDASGWRSTVSVSEAAPSEDEVQKACENFEATGSGESTAEKREMYARVLKYSSAEPAAFGVAPPEVCARVHAVSRNYAGSDLPVGTPLKVAADWSIVPQLSAGHSEHGNTTHAAMDSVFAFLERGAAGTAAAANAELPQPQAS